MKGLEIAYEWHDVDVLSLLVTVANGAYSGVAQVYVGHDALKQLADALGRGPAVEGERYELSLGNFDPQCADGGASFRIEALDAQGHLACTVTLQNGHAGPGLPQSVTAVFATEPALLDKFLSRLRDFAPEIGADATLEMAT